MSFEEFLKYIGRLASSEEILVVAHVNADPDAVATVLIVKRILEKQGLRVRTCFPEGPSKLSKELLGKLEITYENNCSCGAHYVVVCDTSNEVMLSNVAECLREAEVIVVDHHEPGNLLQRAVIALVDPKEPAATTIAVELAQLAGVDIGAKLATLALGGILYDTRRFVIATPRTLRSAAWLLESGGRYEVALPYPEEMLDYSERVARLKAAQRALFIDICGFIAAATEVTAYEASTARALVMLGADVAIVLGGKEELRVSARASDRILKAGLDIAAVARKVASIFGGEGGGHKGAGGVKVRRGASSNALLRAVTNELIREILTLCREES